MHNKIHTKYYKSLCSAREKAIYTNLHIFQKYGISALNMRSGYTAT